MQKNDIYKAAYEVIAESLDWGIGDDKYGNFVDGIRSLTDRLLDDIDTNNENNITKENT